MDAREAAQRTLDAGSARIWSRAFLEGKPAHPLVGLLLKTVEGVADLTRRRARFKTVRTPEFDAVVEWSERKWPWLDDNDGHEPDRQVLFETVVIGGRRYVGTDERWSLADPSSQLDNPAWILDALAGGRGGKRLGAEEVRGASCERWALEPVDLRTAVRASNGALELPPHGAVEKPTLRGDVWVDGDGRLRRITWARPHWGRPRLRPRKGYPHQVWTTVELWDFGVPVAIEAPEVGPPPEYDASLRDWWELGADLWRRRRAYHSTRTS